MVRGVSYHQPTTADFYNFTSYGCLLFMASDLPHRRSDISDTHDDTLFIALNADLGLFLFCVGSFSAYLSYYSHLSAFTNEQNFKT